MKIKNNTAMRKAIKKQISAILYSISLENYARRIVDGMILDFDHYQDGNAFKKRYKELSKQLELVNPYLAKAVCLIYDQDPHNPQMSLLAMELFKHLKIIDPHAVKEDPFLKYIQVREDVTSKDYSYGGIAINRNQCVLYHHDNKEWKDDFGILEDELVLPALYYKEEVESSLTLLGMKNYQVELEKMKGHVRIFGLHNGYFVYLAHLKNEVDHVTVIEERQEVIDLFYKYILPQFDHPEKITVIYGKVFDHLGGHDDIYFFDHLDSLEARLPAYLELKGEQYAQNKSMVFHEEDQVLEGLLMLIVSELMTCLQNTSEEIAGMSMRKSEMDATTQAFLDELKIQSPAQLSGVLSIRELKKTVDRYARKKVKLQKDK
jgi:hypothetical protein